MTKAEDNAAPSNQTEAKSKNGVWDPMPELTITSNQNIFLTKPYFSITNNEIVKNSKSEPKNSHSCVLLRSTLA
jgi:hypothetical protein